MLELFFILTGLIAVVLAPVALFRIFTAKNRKTYWKSYALFVIPMLLTAGLAQMTGVVDLRAPPKNEIPINFVFPEFSWIQLLLISGAGLLWIVGGNILMYRHRKRMNRSFWSSFNPLTPLFRDFNRRERVTLIALAVGTLLLAALAMSFESTLLP